jgi:protein MpaA
VRPWVAIVSAAIGIAALAALARIAEHPTLIGAHIGRTSRFERRHRFDPPVRHRISRLERRHRSDPLVRRRMVIGHSVRGRAIVATALGDPDASRRLLVVGCIHGNESAGTAIARRVVSGEPPRQAMLWVIEDLNPDGVAAGTRQNADGVDLNRNFPWRWRHLGRRGALQYSGRRPLSEPESRIARALILRVRPRVTIWFHQPLGLVDESGGALRVERRYARLTGMPLRRLTRYPGSAAGWQNHRLPKSTAFVVELPARLGREAARRDARAIRRLLS